MAETSEQYQFPKISFADPAAHAWAETDAVKPIIIVVRLVTLDTVGTSEARSRRIVLRR